MLLLAPARVVLAHSGGAAVLADVEAGPYRLFAYIQPDPSPMGPAHVAVAVTVPSGDKAANGLLEPVTDAQVQLHWEPRSQPGRAFTMTLASPTAASDTFYELDVDIPFADLWRVTIAVSGSQGQGSATFERQVVTTRPINWRLVGGAGVVLVLLLGLIVGWQRMQSASKE